MSSTQHKSLARSIEQWQNCDPHAMATRQSYAAIENAFVDAKHDVLALSTEVAALKALRDELVGALDVMCNLYPPTTAARELLAKAAAQEGASHG